MDKAKDATADFNTTAVAVQPTPDDDDGRRDNEMRENLEQYERLLETDEDAFEQPTTTRRELWAYYCYYNADSGVGPVTYGQALYVYSS